MEKKAFDLIAAKVEEALVEQEFTRQNVEVKEEENNTALYTGESAAYSVIYDAGKKRFELRSCGMKDSVPDNQWKSVSAWLFDPQEDTEREAESIANDFVETIQGPQRKAQINAAKKKKKDDEANVDPLFFMNRLVNFFPELREEIRWEREHYERFRGVIFTKEKVLPLMQRFFLENPTDAQVKKMATVMSDCYASGDLDVRGIITYVIFHSLNDTAIQRLEEYLSEELKKAVKFSVRLKGKKIKPEKKKKEKKIMANTLSGKQ